MYLRHSHIAQLAYFHLGHLSNQTNNQCSQGKVLAPFKLLCTPFLYNKNIAMDSEQTTTSLPIMHYASTLDLQSISDHCVSHNHIAHA